MKSNIEKVYSKLPKTELAKVELEAQKIELGLVDDLKDFIKKGLSIEKKISSDITSYNGLLRSGNGFKNKYGELIKAAKEIGVPVPPELKKLEGIADGFIKKGEALKKVSNLF
jgi:hypothetical protein